MVRQGAAGNLENNYNSMLNALQSAREQQIMEAQAAQFAGSGGGGGGGGGGDAIDQATKYLKFAQSYGDFTGGDGVDLASLMGAAAKKDPAGLLDIYSRLTPQQRQQFGFS
jgi:hypothetical protein